MNPNIQLLIETIVTAILFYILGNIDGHKRGQISVLKGKQKYKLLEFPDGTREFYKNPKPEYFREDFKNYKIIKE
jgi:hypothetical protein